MLLCIRKAVECFKLYKWVIVVGARKTVAVNLICETGDHEVPEGKKMLICDLETGLVIL